MQDNGRVVDTTGFTGVTTKTYLSDLKSGYQASNGPALSLLFPTAGNACVDVGLEGIRTIQDLIDAIKASVMVDAAGARCASPWKAPMPASCWPPPTPARAGIICMRWTPA